MEETEIKTIELSADDQQVALPENRPYYIIGHAGNRIGILLVHGFTGSPWEMRLLGQCLAKKADYTLGVRLPGHGTSAEDLAHRSYEEWLSAVEAGYQHLSTKCDQVIGVGLSTGSLLLLAAAESLTFKGLILLSPYLKMRQWLAPLAGLLQYVIKFNRRPVEAELAPYYYQDRPLSSVHQINRLIRRVRKNLSEINIPVLVASASGDMTVDSRSAIDLYNRLGSRKKEYYQFGREVPHVLTTADNPELNEVFKITSRFTEALTPG